MDFTPTEFNALICGLKSGFDGSLNEAPLVIFASSDIWGRFLSGGHMVGTGLSDHPEIMRRGAPKLIIDASDELRARIDGHFTRHSYSGPEAIKGAGWPVGHSLAKSNRFEINGRALYCCSIRWPVHYLTISTFTPEQSEIFTLRAADLFREFVEKLPVPGAIENMKLEAPDLIEQTLTLTL